MNSATIQQCGTTRNPVGRVASSAARTRMVAFTHTSNVLGVITPAKEMIRLAHEKGIPVLVDGAQSAVHLNIDVQDMDCDFFTFTGHKLYGPTGIGVLYGKSEHLEAMPPYQGGGRAAVGRQ